MCERHYVKRCYQTAANRGLRSLFTALYLHLETQPDHNKKMVLLADLVSPTLWIDKNQDGLHERGRERLQHERTPFRLLKKGTDREPQ